MQFNLVNCYLIPDMMESIAAEELLAKMENDQVRILDVREAWEFEEENLGGIIRNISVYELPQRWTELADWKSEEIVIHCKTGKRSRQACKVLMQHGFQNLRFVEGGIEAVLELR